MSKQIFTQLTLTFMLFFSLSAFNVQGQATITTDKPDYAPRSNAVFTGSGFSPNEDVVLKVKNLFRDCNTVTEDSSYLPWTVTADANGSFVTEWTVCDCPGDSLRLKATGQTSGYIAYAYFTDAVTISGPTSACVGSSVTYTSSVTGLAFSYQWKKNGSNISGATANNYTISSVAATDAASYTVTITGIGAGTSNAITLVVNPSPTVPTAVTASPNTICSGSLLALNATSAGNTIRWYIVATGGSNIGTSASGANFSVSPTSTTTYYAEALNAGGCPSATRTPVTVTVNATPAATPTVSGSTSVCSVENLTYSVTAVTGASYNWEVPTGWSINSGQNSNSISVTSGATGQSGDIIVTVSNSCGTGVGTLAVNFLDDIGYGGVATANSAITCQGVPPSQIIIGGAAPQGPTYLWQVSINGGGFGSAAGDNNNVDYVINSTYYNTVGTYLFRRVISSSSTACNGNSDNVTLTVNAPPTVAALTGIQTVCPGSTTTFSSTTPGGVWGTNNAGIASVSDGVVSGISAGTTNISYTVTGANGCITTVTRSVTVITAPSATPTITGSASICSVEGLTYSVTAVAGASYVWEVPTGWTINSGQNSNSISVTSGATGQSGDIIVTVSNSCGTGVGTLAVNFLDDIGYGGVATANSAATCRGVAPSQTIIGGAAPSGPNYQWQVNSNGAGFVNINGATSQNYTISSDYYNVTGVYIFRRVISSSTTACNGNSDNVTLTVDAPIVAALTGTQTICLGSTTTFSSTTGGGVWGTDNAGVATVTGGVVSGISAGAANISYAVTNANGCTTTEFRSVTVIAIPTAVSALPPSSTICVGDNVNLTGSAGVLAPVTLLSENFNNTGGTLFSVAGSNSGGGIVWTQENSGFNVALVATWTSPDASRFMLTYAASFGNATTNSTLVSTPVMNSTGYTTLSLSFKHTYKQGDEGSPFGMVEVSTDPGNTVWTPVQTYTTNQGTSTAFATVTGINLDAYVNQPNLKIRFNFSSSVSLANSWWAIDDVVLTGTLVPLYSWTASPAGSGLTAAQQSPSNANSSISVNPATTTDYTLTVTNPATNCFSNSTPITVVVNTPPVITETNISPVNNDANICGASVTMGSNLTITGTTPITTVYSLTSGGAAITNPNNFPVGVTTVYAKATNICGSDEKTFTVTVVDNQKPTVLTQPVTIYLDANGAASVTTAQVNNGSTDNCSIATYSLDKTDFDCSNVGPNTVTLTVTDVNGNSDHETAVVTVVDNIKPTVLTQPVTIYLDANGAASVTTAQVNNGSTDNCSIATYTLNKTDFDCSNVGPNTVILTVTDVNGNSDHETAVVTVVDNIKPTVLTQPVTIYLDANGAASVTTAQVNNGSTDNCSIATYSLDKTDFDCSNVGPNTVILTVTDVNGNSDHETAVVTVVDNIKPTVLTQPVTIYLDANGAASVTTAQVNNGSTDNCSIATYTLDKTDFDCSNVGPNTVTLTVTDVNGNSDHETAVVTVVDNIKPTVLTQPVTIYLDANGAASVTTAQVNNGSTDNCSIATYTLDKTDFDCSNVGPNTVTLTVTDVNGNSDSKTVVVTVIDNINPVVTAATDVVTTTSADGTGNCTVAVPIINAVISDNCLLTLTWKMTGATLGNSPSTGINQAGTQTFNIGITTITYTVTDGSGNTTTDAMTVTVTDDESPVLSACPNNVSIISLSNNCFQNQSWTKPTFTDNCTGTILTVSTSNPSVLIMDLGPSSFASFPVGTTTVTYLATDPAGNTATCSFTVSVLDIQSPTITGCPADITVFNQTGVCKKRVTWNPPTASDNCSGASMTTTDLPGNYFPVGVTTVTYTATDASGNTSTCSFKITVIDNELPTIVAAPAVSVFSDADQCSATVTLIAPATSDNCGIQDVTNDHLSTIYAVGTTTVTWIVTDIHGNTNTATQLVTVTDNIKPTITAPLAKTVTTNVACTSTGVELGTPVTADNCSVASVTNNAPAAFPLGVTTVTWTVTDGSGNTATATQLVTVTDNINPTFTRPADKTIYTNATCGYDASVAATGDVTNEADNCSTGLQAAYTDVVTNGTCQGSKVITRTWRLVDNYGNAAANQVQTITILDNIKPTFTRPADKTIYTTATCTYNASVTVTGDVTNEADNCSTGLQATFTDVVANGSCQGSKVITRTWSLVDNCGNAAANQVQTITILDNIKPTFTRPADKTIYTNATCGYDASVAATGDVTNEADNCSAGLQATYTDVVTNGACQGGKVIIRTWRLVDNCGNAAANQVQTITILDNIKPVVTCTSNKSVYVNSAPYSYKQSGTSWDATATDNCSSTTIKYTLSGVTTCGSNAYTTLNNVVFNKGITTVSVQAYDASNNVSASCTFTVTVGANLATTTTSVISSLNPSKCGQAVTFTATVSRGSSTKVPSGTVTFKDGTTTLGTGAVTVVGGAYKATFKTSNLAAGNHSITAIYGGDANFNSSTSATLTQKVSSAIARVNTSDVMAPRVDLTAVTSQPLTLKAYPNPTTSYFNLAITGNIDNPVTVRVLDGRGKVVQLVQKISAPSTLRLGDNWTNGMYIIEVIQGREIKMVKVVKAN